MLHHDGGLLLHDDHVRVGVGGDGVKHLGGRGVQLVRGEGLTTVVRARGGIVLAEDEQLVRGEQLGR